MIDVVVRLENVTGPDGEPLDDDGVECLRQALYAGTAQALTTYGYHAAGCNVSRQPYVGADRTDEAAVAAQAEQARRRAWHEDDSL